MTLRLLRYLVSLALVLCVGTGSAWGLVGPRKAILLSGGIRVIWSGPASGTVSVPSTNFTVTLIAAQFNGAQTVTLTDNGAGGLFAPSVGGTGTGSVVVTPANHATGFTFTYTPTSTPATIVLTLTNAQKWQNPGNLTYISSSGGGGCNGTLNLSSGCGAQPFGII